MFEDKFIAFIDVLGFKGMVASSEAGTGMELPELLELLKKLGDGSERVQFDKYGPTCCPMAPREEIIHYHATYAPIKCAQFIYEAEHA